MLIANSPEAADASASCVGVPAGLGVVAHRAAGPLAHRDHARGPEHLAADVVAVGGVVVADAVDRLAVVLKLHARRARLRPPQGNLQPKPEREHPLARLLADRFEHESWLGIIYHPRGVDQCGQVWSRLHEEPGVHADAVPADPRPRTEDVDARVTVGQADGLPEAGVGQVGALEVEAVEHEPDVGAHPLTPVAAGGIGLPGAGQHGVATATVCALLGLDCVVYMGAEDMRRQRPNVERMGLLGAEVRPVEFGTKTLKEATSEAIRDWITNVETTHYLIGSAVGPHPYPDMVARFQSVISEEIR